ncbi:DUF4157 domain-containing protein [Streptomyces sp. NPDC102274]|uniref:eCIS core domain-containing protein n=1 Tax=Streptomyces sp. NPDC102274 TaxID=3366151 RepID=UPI00382472C9
MRAYKSQVEQTSGRGSNGRTETPSTFAQRVLALQRAVGNAVVARAVEEEQHEHGAACGHEQPSAEQTPVDQSSIQRSSVIDAVRSPGRPLDSRIMEKAEQGYGMSFRHVRVHSGPVAQHSAMALGARAYTTGSDIVVGPQGTDDETMFHELDHVRQQSLGTVSGTDNGAGVKVSHEDDPFERHATANGRRMARGATPDLSAPGSGTPAPTATPGRSDGGVAVARMMSGGSRLTHQRDRGQMVEINGDQGPFVGRYGRSSSDGTDASDTTQGRINVYGLENRKAVPEAGMRLTGEFSDAYADLEDHGYGHRQSTKDEGAAVAERRKTYRTESDRRSNSPGEENPSYRSRSQAHSSSRRRG